MLQTLFLAMMVILFGFEIKGLGNLLRKVYTMLKQIQYLLFIPSSVESLLDLEKRGRTTKVPVTRSRITDTNIGT